MAEICSQCNKFFALYKMNGFLLCLNCAQKVDQMYQSRQIENAQMINYLTEHMEAVTGISGILPKMEIPRPSTLIQGGVTLNNISVSNSVIGAINTGNIQQIDVALSNIRNSGDSESSKIIKEFTEAILNQKTITEETKNEIIEQIVFLTSQIQIPKETRKKSIVKPILDSIANSIQYFPDLMGLLGSVKRIFGI